MAQWVSRVRAAKAKADDGGPEGPPLPSPDDPPAGVAGGRVIEAVSLPKNFASKVSPDLTAWSVSAGAETSFDHSYWATPHNG